MNLIKEYKINERPEITRPEEVYKRMKDVKNMMKECFVVFFLNTQNKIIAREIVSIGILDQAIIHPREVYRSAIIRHSKKILLCHNHPSGVCTPSKNDIEITEELVMAGEILRIRLVDHVIVSPTSYYSMAEHGDIKRK